MITCALTMKEPPVCPRWALPTPHSILILSPPLPNSLIILPFFRSSDSKFTSYSYSAATPKFTSHASAAAPKFTSNSFTSAPKLTSDTYTFAHESTSGFEFTSNSSASAHKFSSYSSVSTSTLLFHPFQLSAYLKKECSLLCSRLGLRWPQCLVIDRSRVRKLENRR